MQLLHEQPMIGDIPPADAEVLIREARRLRRRRWMAACLVVVVLAGGIAISLIATGGGAHSSPPTALSFHTGSPTVNAQAFVGQGDLAFVSRKTLYDLDGNSGAIRRLLLSNGDVASTPSFSYDGKWLAFAASRTVTASNGDESTSSSVWVAHASGTGLHELSGFTDPALVAWSPVSDLLAVTNQGEIPTTFHGPLPQDGYAVRQTSLWVVSPNGSRHEVMTSGSGEIDGAAWSPDGSALAVGSLSAYPYQGAEPWTTTLATYPINDGHPTVWLRVVNPRSNSCCSTANLKQSEFMPVGWWAHWGIVFWAPSAVIDGSILVGGGISLFALPTNGGKPVSLGKTLADGQVSPIVASSTDELAITSEPNSHEGARPFWQNEQVERCDPATLHCVAVLEPPGTISFDPVWSPDGSTLAYLVGRAENGQGNAGFAQRAVASWYNSVSLRLYSATTGTSIEVRMAKGAVVPIWSADSKDLLYVDNDGLWLLKSAIAQPVEVAGPLLPPKHWNAYFAQLDWSDQFAWSAAS